MSRSVFPTGRERAISRRGAALLLVAFLLLAAQPLAAATKEKPPERFFTYTVQKKTLPNGLDVLVIETPEFKNVLSYNTLVLAGARNETQRGTTGLAHLFEHILFRHRYGGIVNGYDEAISRLGAHNNAWTWFDVTYYHPLTFTSNLHHKEATVAGKKEEQAGIAELESSRFTALDFDQKIFQTETGAVLGEYRRNASQPALKMEERLLDLAYPNLPYGHTTIGYYDDVLAMPQHYEAAVKFYQTYYRPNNCVLIVVGDVHAAEIFATAERHYSHWQRGELPPLPKPETIPPPGGEKREHVGWDADVAPRMFIAFRVPQFRSASVETAVGELLPELLVHPSAPLYKKLRFEKQTASEVSLYESKQAYESFDPRLFILDVQLYKEKYQAQGPAYFEDVLRDVTAALEELKNLDRRKDAAETLRILKSKYRYDFLSNLTSPADIAETLAWLYRFERDPEVFDHLVASVERLKPADFSAYAKKFFVPANRVIVTMSRGDQAAKPAN